MKGGWVENFCFSESSRQSILASLSGRGINRFTEEQKTKFIKGAERAIARHKSRLSEPNLDDVADQRAKTINKLAGRLIKELTAPQGEDAAGLTPEELESAVATLSTIEKRSGYWVEAKAQDKGGPRPVHRILLEELAQVYKHAFGQAPSTKHNGTFANLVDSIGIQAGMSLPGGSTIREVLKHG